MIEFTPAQAHVILDALAALRDQVDNAQREPWLDYATGPKELFTSYRQLIDQCAEPFTAIVGGERPADDYGHPDSPDRLIVDHHAPATGTQTVTVAMIDTSHYSWHGIGHDRDSAREALLSAWREHLRQTPWADPDAIISEDFNYIAGNFGQGFCDNRPSPAPPR